MNLYQSSIRTFTILDASNNIIFSSVSLSPEFASQISALPCAVACLGASFEVNVESWRTDTRSCVFLHFPLVAASGSNKQETYPVYAFATAEPQMSFSELRQRCIIYFRCCQALFSLQDLRAPWIPFTQKLSIAPSYVLQVLLTAEKMIDRDPALLRHCFLQYPPVPLRQLERGEQMTSPSILLQKIV